MTVYLKYVGSGFLPGVPKRDLSEEEAKQHGISKLLKSGLYARAAAPSKPKPSTDKSLPGGSENKEQ